MTSATAEITPSASRTAVPAAPAGATQVAGTKPTATGWHLAGIIAGPSLGALILNGIGFFNMLEALAKSSLGDTGAHWILAGGLELGIVGFALAAFCLSLLNRPSKAAQVFTVALSIVSATIGYAHVTSTGDEIAVRAFVAAAPIIAAGAWHWTLKGVKSVLVDDDLEQKAEAAMMRAAIAARMDHARLDELAKTASGAARWFAGRRLAYAASRSYATQKAVALGVAPQRQRDVSETFVNGAVSVAAVLAEVRPIDVSVSNVATTTQAPDFPSPITQRSTADADADASAATQGAAQLGPSAPRTLTQTAAATPAVAQLSDAASVAGAVTQGSGPARETAHLASHEGPGVDARSAANSALPAETQVAASRSVRELRDAAAGDAAVAEESDAAQVRDAGQSITQGPPRSGVGAASVTQPRPRTAGAPSTTQRAPRRSARTARDLVDLVEVHRMRTAQPPASWRAIGDVFGVSADTARRAYEAAQRAPETPAQGIRLAAVNGD